MVAILTSRRDLEGAEGSRPGAAELVLARRADGRLTAAHHGVESVVWVRQAFPWTEPGRFLSLRNDAEDEVALVEDVAGLEPASRRALEEALVVAGFVLTVTRVVTVDEEVEVRHWRVETRHGPRLFQTRLDDWPRELPGGGLLIKDVAGDLYHVPSPGDLDKRSRELLWAFVD